jgi:DNA-binding winged helix-turn-helix (wHTH) protein
MWLRVGRMRPELNSTIESDTDVAYSRSSLLVSRYIRFGPFQVDQQRQEVTKGGSRLKLQGKVFQVLLALIEKQCEIVTREELRIRLWPADTHVNYDANVNTTVNKLRQALGDSSDKPLYIETIPRKGYCLMVRPEYTDIPLAPPSTTLSRASGSALRDEPPPSTPKFDIWITLGVIALILAGMLLGAGITKLWIMHFLASGGTWI